MQVCQKRAVLAAVPPEKIKRAIERLSRRARGVRRIIRGQAPARSVCLIEPQNAPHIVVDLDLVKIRRVLRPLHLPTRRLREIMFVRAIPACSGDFTENNPTNRRCKIKSRKEKVEISAVCVFYFILSTF